MLSTRTPACAVALVLAAGFALAQPIVIAHRGASGYLPEHTLEAYAMAHALGADYIEQDLVMTQDGTLVCLHDIHLESTTDVEERFPDRAREDGQWYAADFTLAEIKTLRVHERLPRRFPVGLADFVVPTFAEAVELVQGLNTSTGRTAGIYPELKQPSFHRREGLDMPGPFVEALRRYGYDAVDARIFIQCFEHGTLRELREEHGVKAPMVALVGGDAFFDRAVSAEGLAEIAAYAQGVGPDKGRVIKDPELVMRAHAHKLAVHPYTLRADAVPRAYADLEAEMRALFVELGVDGAFTDHTDRARAFIDAHAAEFTAGDEVESAAG